MTAAQVLWAAAARHPDRPCVTDLDEAGSIRTYAQLVERAVAVGGGLRGLGTAPGDRVALLLPNGHAYVELRGGHRGRAGRGAAQRAAAA